MKNKKNYTSKSIIAVLLTLSMIIMICTQFISATAITDNTTKIDDNLKQMLNNMTDDQKIDVSIWINDINYSDVIEDTEENLQSEVDNNEISVESLDILDTDVNNSVINDETLNQINSIDSNTSEEEANIIIEEKRDVAKSMYVDSNNDVLEEILPTGFNNEDIIYVCHYAPNLILTLTKAQVYSACNNNKVSNIYYYDKEAELLTNENNFDLSENDVSNLTNTYNFSTEQYEVTGIDTLRDVFGYTGSGIKIGIIDYPFANSSDIDYFSDNAFEIYYCSSSGLIDSYSSHANCVSCIMAGNYTNSETGDTFVGAVPDAKLYATAGIDFRSGLEVLLDNGVNLINSSLIFGGDGNNNYGDTAKWIDHIVSQHNVTYIGAAGNSGTNGIGSGQMGYNSIAVGSCNNNGALSSYSSYTASTDKSYKPDLVALGENYILPATRDNPQQAPGTSSGTSFSAPIVSGAVAQLCQASATLKFNPRMMKAVLLAGTTITDSMTESQMLAHEDGTIALDRQYGAGMLNVLNSYALVSAREDYRYGTITVPTSSATKNLSINASAGKIIRICAVWDKPNTISNTHSNGAIVSPEIEQYKLKVTTPTGDVYTAYNAYDTKSMVSFISTGSGSYTIELIRQGDIHNGTTTYGIAASVQNR